MVRSFNLSYYKNSIWRGREYADLWYQKKKKKQRPYRWRVRWSDGGKAWLSSQIFLSPPSMIDRSSLAIVQSQFLCFEFGEGTDGGGKSDSNSVLPLSLLCFSLRVPGLIASLYFHLCVYCISISLSLLLSPFPRRLSLSFIASLLRSVCIWRCNKESQVWVWILIGKYDLGFRVCRFFFFFFCFVLSILLFKGLHLFGPDFFCSKIPLHP